MVDIDFLARGTLLSVRINFDIGVAVPYKIVSHFLGPLKDGCIYYPTVFANSASHKYFFIKQENMTFCSNIYCKHK